MSGAPFAIFIINVHRRCGFTKWRKALRFSALQVLTRAANDGTG